MGNMNNTALELAVIQNGTVVAKQIFDQDKIVIGRILSADFRIPNPQVSRIHALLELLDDSSLKLTDLASTHGTFVNGQRIVEQVLRDGDEIKLADVTLKLSWIRSEKTAAPVHVPVKEKTEVPSPSVPAPASPGVDSIDGMHRPREATVIRSLKETARTRGALDPTGKRNDELEITVYWEETVLAIDHYKKGNRLITIGDGVHSDYIVPEGAFPDKFEFIKLKGNTAELKIHPSMKMSARIHGHMYTMDDLQKSGREKIELSGGDIAKVRVGSVHFFIMFVPDPPPLPMAPFFSQGKLYWSMLFMVTLFTCMFMAYSFLFQEPIEGQVKEFPEKYRKIIVKNFKQKQIIEKKEEEKKVESNKLSDQKATSETEQPIKTAQTKQESSSQEGSRAQGAEGKRGEKNAKSETGKTSRPKAQTQAKAKQPTKSKKPPKKVGLLESLRNSGVTSKIAELTGDPGEDNVKEAFAGVGGGNESARGSAPRGGLQGTGSGGGGQVEGVGGLGTEGFGKGAKGTGDGVLPGKGDASVSTEGGGISVGSGLSKEEIDRVVKAHMSEVRFCYQQALQKNPNISGKVSIAWTIGSGGVVNKTRTTVNTTGSSSLADCIRMRLRQWTFPSPPNGGSVEVEQYPFILKPSGT